MLLLSYHRRLGMITEVMAMLGWVEAGMEVVDGMHVGQSRGEVGRLSGDAGAFPECEVMTPDHITVQVRSCGLGRAEIGRSSWKGLNTGRHEKVPVCCPCSWLATLHGTPRSPLIDQRRRH